jgi:uncharacterized damage-inducible protein DinB
MIGCEYVVAMAAYNEWMNAKVYASAGGLSAEALSLERNAFFGSIMGTLNHLVAGDTLWLKRFATHPTGHVSLDPIRELPHPDALNRSMFENFDELLAQRRMLDALIREWAADLTEADLSHVLSYNNMQGVPARKSFAGLLAHFFNHQTHHRGQATTLLSQAGQDVGVTDFVALLPDAGDA